MLTQIFENFVSLVQEFETFLSLRPKPEVFALASRAFFFIIPRWKALILAFNTRRRRRKFDFRLPSVSRKRLCLTRN